MVTKLIERLKSEIARQESKRGPNDPSVKDLKEQLRSSLATQGTSTQDVDRSQTEPMTTESRSYPYETFEESNMRIFQTPGPAEVDRCKKD